MTNWVKGNRLKTLSIALGIIISVFIIIGFIGPVDIIADHVYKTKKPDMMKALDSALEVQELRLEPRLQAIETEQRTQRITSEERWEENMEIQKEILKEVRK